MKVGSKVTDFGAKLAPKRIKRKDTKEKIRAKKNNKDNEERNPH